MFSKLFKACGLSLLAIIVLTLFALYGPFKTGLEEGGILAVPFVSAVFLFAQFIFNGLFLMILSRLKVARRG